jgi:hypothetical protein
MFSEEYFQPHNIYITSDEEIKEGDWCYQVELNDGKIDKCYDVTLYHTWTNNGVDKKIKYKKIILTTDQELIKDGVQAIDDEFIEWFVKNPSCEYVNIEKYHGINTSIAEVNAVSGDGSLNWEGKSDLRDYKIIIPKEEPKQGTMSEAIKQVISNQLKQETLEQETFLGKTISKKDADKDSFEDVTKYKIEKGYSEEEMLKMLHKFGFDYTYNYRGEKTIYEWIPEWFEEYKRLLTI